MSKETKKMLVMLSSQIFLAMVFAKLFFFGTKPKKTNLFISSPESWRQEIIDDGPGTLVIKIFFLIKFFTSLYPGSDINGDPASEIKAISESL